jgi:hypothetical protein
MLVTLGVNSVLLETLPIGVKLISPEQDNVLVIERYFIIHVAVWSQ